MATEAQRAVRIGLLAVNGPILILLALPYVLLSGRGGVWAPIGVVLGFVAAWLYWSIAIPRWREWALRRGADPDELQHRAEKVGLVWKRGSVFERTEFRPRRREE
jgi:hypothetical protein